MRSMIQTRRYFRLACLIMLSTAWAAIGVDAAPPPPSAPPAPILIGISISGPSAVDMGTTAQFICDGLYSDGSRSVLSSAWSANSSDATISESGLLTVQAISADQTATLTATYAGFSTTFGVTFQYVPPVLTRLAITGPASINEGTMGTYRCTATYSDGFSEEVVPVWSENSSSTIISASGVLRAGNVSSDQNVTISASYGGQFDTHAVVVKYIPPTITSLTISGPTSMNESSAAQLVCTARYTDGSSVIVTPIWGENSVSTLISTSGILRAGTLSADLTVTVSASYDGRFDTHTVVVKDVPPVLTSLTISGAVRINEGASAQYSCTANYSDGTSALVSASWSDNAAFASINRSGVLVAGSVSSDESLTLTASYGGKTDTFGVTVVYIAPAVTLTRLTILGPSSVNENNTAQYFCVAHYSDGTSQSVTPEWSENSAFATVSGAGLLQAQNVAADETLTITARFGGVVGTRAVAIWVVSHQVIYPLSGFEGKTVSAELWNETAQEMTILGQEGSPEEVVIENVTPGQWYWLGLREFDEASGDWVLVHGDWFTL